MKKIILLLATTIQLGCTGPLTFAVDTEFTNEERELIISAVDEWILATDSDDAAVFFRFDLVQDKPFTIDDNWDNTDIDYGTIYKLHTYEPGYIEWMEERDPFGGIARPPDRMAIVPENIAKPSLFRRVVLHEFGHIYGIDHQDSGIMQAGEVDIDCIDSLALELFCDCNYCGPNAASTCED